MSKLRIKNWHEFQHFKDRTPPWIKLHKTILDQRDINAISDCSFRVLIGLWLLASEDHAMQGNLPSIDDIAFRLRMSNAVINKALHELKPFVIQDDITAISPRYQDDAPETETEAEEKTEKETELFDFFWKSWPSHSRKVNKKGAEKIWERDRLDSMAGDVMAALEVWKRSESWTKNGGEFIPGPVVWLNQRRYEDTEAASAKPAATKPTRSEI
jgi:hypothetical protein